MSYEYRVIEILDEYSILINYGRDNGAYKNNEVRVVSVGPEIIDPETNESLGTLDFVKETLTIITPYDKFSLCRKVEKITRNIIVSPLAQFNTSTLTNKSLNVDEVTLSNNQLDNDPMIKIGDKIEIM